jgi:hypothetical protein
LAEFLADLVGARGAGRQSELGRCGYSYVTMTHGTQYLWNAERSACVVIKVAGGRYKSVNAASASRAAGRRVRRPARRGQERLRDDRQGQLRRQRQQVVSQ